MDKATVLTRLAQDKPKFHHLSEEGVRLATAAGITKSAGDIKLGGRSTSSSVDCRPRLWRDGHSRDWCGLHDCLVCRARQAPLLLHAVAGRSRQDSGLPGAHRGPATRS